MSPVHTAYRRRPVVRLAGACALAGCVLASCGDDRVAPTLDSVTPARACSAVTITLAGSGFEARVAGLLGRPTAEAPAVLAATSGGSPVTLPSRWQSADAIAADVPATLAAGSYDLTVVNPDGARATLAGAFSVDAAPTITSVTPPQLCSTGGDFTVTGDALAAGAAVTLDDGAMTLAGGDVAVASPTQLTVHFGSNTFANNASLTLTVTNPDGCSGALANALHRKTGSGGCP
jgi:hypothetical protein